MTLKVVGTVGLRLNEREPYGFDLTKFCAKYFESGQIYDLGEVVRPIEVEDGGRGPTGKEYVVTQAGQVLYREPSWPTVDAGTVTSGGVIFMAQPISNASLKKTIIGSVWASAIGVTVDDDAVLSSGGEQATAAFVKADATATAPSEVVNTVTFSDGQVEKFAIKIKKIVDSI